MLIVSTACTSSLACDISSHPALLQTPSPHACQLVATMRLPALLIRSKQLCISKTSPPPLALSPPQSSFPAILILHKLLLIPKLAAPSCVYHQCKHVQSLTQGGSRLPWYATAPIAIIPASSPFSHYTSARVSPQSWLEEGRLPCMGVLDHST